MLLRPTPSQAPPHAHTTHTLLPPKSPPNAPTTPEHLIKSVEGVVAVEPPAAKCASESPPPTEEVFEDFVGVCRGV